ncbi:CdiA C-terminal domain-containing protein [Sphingobacterium multivorum]|uniref:CdiA C-terminal domain-containing protein n=1 Tax=Sphingobacterium multivorum TaxID=28454 RepID=UPI0028A5FD8F|nr:hypothetical protein [Sphingobacterium multivorum]
MTNREIKRKIKRISEKADWIDTAVKELEKLVTQKQNEFAQEFLLAMIEQLEVEEGRILYSFKNRKLIQRLGKIIEGIKSKSFIDVVQKMVSSVNNIVSENIVYYGSITPDKKLFKASSDQIKEIVFNRLGFDKEGNLMTDGYMQGLFDAPEVSQKLKEYVHQGAATKSGFESFRRSLRTLIEGEPEKLGIFERFYRNYAYDTYSQIDRLQSKLLAEDLELKYFIYSGGLIKTSRLFCIRKNGRVFTTEEAKTWEDEEDNTAKPPNYEPLIHCGGYGCRHSPNYITYEMAIVLRPDLKQQQDYVKEYKNDKGGLVEVHPDYDPKDQLINLEKAKVLADHGYKVKIRPVVNADKVKNPEFEVNGLISDLKVLKNGSKNGFQNGASDVIKKGGASVVFDITDAGYLNKKLKTLLHSTFGKPKRYHALKDIILIKNNKAVTIAKTEIVNGWDWVKRSRFR